MSARHERTPDAPGTVGAIFLAAALAAFRGRPGIRAWAEECAVVVPSEANRMLAGRPYDFSKFPCMASLIFSFFEGKSRELILLKDTQGGASTHAVWAVAWMLAFDPGNVIFITKGRDSARDAGRDRMKHIFDGIPQLRRNRKDGIGNSTAMAWRFAGGAMFLGGCDSVTALIGQPASRVILDELKEHPFLDGKSTLDLARMRIKADAEGKIFAFSTAGDAVEYDERSRPGQKIPIRTPESIAHLEYLSGSMEEVQVPCPHCGHFQPLEFERLQFGHCKESLPGMPGNLLAWNRERVVLETWYRCANPDCTDRDAEGKQRGRIEESSKPGMVAQHRWVATNPRPFPGRRSATISVLVNIAVPTQSWGHVALAFLDAQEKGDAAALKAFHTDYLGRPWAPHRVTGAQMAKLLAMKQKYRRAEADGQTLRHVIPFPTSETYFVGGVVDVQADHVKWLIHAAALDGRSAVLDWGMCQFVEQIPDVFRERWWRCAGETDPTVGFPVSLVFMDVNGTRRAELYRALYQWAVSFPEISWEGVAGRDRGQTRAVKIAAWQPIEYPVMDEFRRPLHTVDMVPITVRVNNIDADFWESELYGICIDRFDPRGRAAELVEKGLEPAAAELAARQEARLWLPGDVNEGFLRELCNMKQTLKAVGTGGHKEYRWVKINSGPNDFGDLCKYAQVQIHAVREAGR